MIKKEFFFFTCRGLRINIETNILFAPWTNIKVEGLAKGDSG
jgi:hypothetical protein